MVLKRSDYYTVEEKKVEYFSDFTINMDKNPLTGYLARLTNEESVAQSIKSLILTQRTERPFQPYVGSKIFSLLFEPNDVLTIPMLHEEIKTTLENYEPRATILDVRTASSDNNNIYITIVFSVKTIPDKQFITNILLKRVR